MRLPLTKIKSDFVCVEVGVWKGDFSEQILNCNPAKLILIDPWLFQPKLKTRMYGGVVAKSQSDMDNIHGGVVSRFGSKVQIIRKKSNEAYKELEDASVDWVYIDGDHDYASVMEDLMNFYPKIKKGGFLTGDDYAWETVRKAVDEFVKDRQLTCKTNRTQFIINL